MPLLKEVEKDMKKVKGCVSVVVGFFLCVLLVHVVLWIGGFVSGIWTTMVRD